MMTVAEELKVSVAAKYQVVKMTVTTMAAMMIIARSVLKKASSSEHESQARFNRSLSSNARRKVLGWEA